MFTLEVQPNAEFLPIHLCRNTRTQVFEGRDVVDSDRVLRVEEESVQNMVSKGLGGTGTLH